MNKSELKLEYKKLIREGKKDLAEAKLKQLWSNNEEEVIPVAIAKEVVKKKENSLNKLVGIKGLGKETLKDLKRIYSTEEELKEALLEDKVPLNNSIVKKLKEYFVLN